MCAPANRASRDGADFLMVEARVAVDVSEAAPAGAAPHVAEFDADEQAHFDAGVHAFNTGDFYAAHDHFEALWGDDFWKGLVQASVALHHHVIGNDKGLSGLPENVQRLLAPYRPTHMGLDLVGFLAAFDHYLESVPPGADPGDVPVPRLLARTP